MKEIKKYCSGLDCWICDEAEPCIYRIANKLQEQLNRKEEENETLKQEVNTFKQALDEIEKNIKDYCKIMCMAETRETCEICQNTEILNIINKAKIVNNS